MLDFARWAELLLLAGIALVVLGPKELPRVLYVFGLGVRKIRAFFDDVQGQFETFMHHMEHEEAEKEKRKNLNLPSRRLYD